MTGTSDRAGSGGNTGTVARAEPPRGFEPGTKGNPLLPVRTVARRLGVSKRTVQRLIQRGQFPGWQPLGNQVRIPEADVVAYAARERRRRGANWRDLSPIRVVVG